MRRQRVPLGTELVEPFAGRIARSRVASVGVERMAVVGRFRRTVAALGGAELCGGHAGAGLRLRSRDDWRPCARAGAGAAALVALVLLEQVQRATGRIDEDRAEPGLAGVDSRGAGVGGRSGSG